MDLLVTGGAGFIGANFVRTTLATRPEVRVTVLDLLTYAGKRESLPEESDRLRFVEGDVADTDLVDELVRGADAVVHLAAESHNERSYLDPRRFVRTNVVGTAELLEAVRRHGTRFHHVSTDEVFGDLGVGSTDRSTPTSRYDPTSPYAASKAASDLLVRSWVRTYAVAATISLSGNNYGPYQHVEKFVPRQVTEVLDGRRPKVFGSGQQVRDWIHVADHVDAVWAVLERGRPGETYLVGAGHERSNVDMVRTLLELMGQDPDAYDHVPDRPAHDGRYALDIGATTTELGWQPRRDLREGLAQTVDWYRDNAWWWRPDKPATEEFYAALGR